MLWDYGTWEVLDGKKPNFKKGIIKFKLYGKRLEGYRELVERLTSKFVPGELMQGEQAQDVYKRQLQEFP